MASLLLRLFHSDYFSPHLALSYLKTYSENIGITYYLVDQLNTAFPAQEVEFYWPQLCHLLLTKPSESRALECFILDRCERSVHVALLVSNGEGVGSWAKLLTSLLSCNVKTLWYFQASLSDLSSDPSTTSFQTCQRVFNQCQRILFDDPLSASSELTQLSGEGSASTSALPATAASSTHASASRDSGHVLANNVIRRGARESISLLARLRGKVLPHNAMTTVVGMGAVLASTPGMPSLSQFSGRIAIQQGRKPAEGVDRPTRRPSQEDEDNSEDGELEEDDGEGDEATSPSAMTPQTNHAGSSSSTHAPYRPSPLTRSGTTPATFSPTTASHSLSLGPSASTPAPKRPENPFSAFAANFGEFRDKAAAAVGDAFGQTFKIEAPPGFQDPSASGSKAAKEPPAWHPQRGTQGRLKRDGGRSSDPTFRVRAANSRSVPNLVQQRNSVGAFASAVALASDPNSSTTSLLSTEASLALYDAAARRRLLRASYCRTQSQFLLTLQDISARLLLLPKQARLSALRAELTQLNHTLPAEVCFPMWCDARTDCLTAHIDGPDASSPAAVRHHRVVRINPSEAVVLNSADRVPFLLHVEVLQNDLDFDPERRQNRESLKRLVVKESERRRKDAFARGAVEAGRASGEEVVGVGSERRGRGKTLPEIPGGSADGDDDGETTPEVQTSSPGYSSRPTSPSPQRPTPAIRTSSPTIGDASLEPEEGEEMDLTEQAYGSDLATFGEEGVEEEEEDLALLNLDHDTAAWTRAVGPAGKRSQKGSNPSTAPSSPVVRRKDFSLDEYSERMRTAAIMLAQLNQSTNAAASPMVTAGPVSQGVGWAGWVLGTGMAAAGGAVKLVAGRSEAGQGSVGVKAPVNVNGTVPPISTSAMNGSTTSSLTSPRASTSLEAAAAIRTAASAGLSSGGVIAGGGSAASRLLHADTEAIRKRIMHEMMTLEEERMERMKSGGRVVKRPNRMSGAGGSGVEDEATVLRAVNKDDPSAAMFRESWADKKARIRASSPYGHLNSWDVFSVIVKTGADLRQEQLAVQLIKEFGRVWDETGCRCWVRYFRILVTSENSGLMETVTDALSVHSIKKEAYARQVQGQSIKTYSLYDHFLDTFGEPSSAKFNKARRNFMESLAGYSIISYLLQIKDRHNGNILVDGDGRVIHIDFGFMLGISPGGVGFEAAPFKMPQEYIDIIGGVSVPDVSAPGTAAGAATAKAVATGAGTNPHWETFRTLLKQGFRDVRKHAERIIMVVELMQKDSKLPCFALGDATASHLRDRFQLALSASQCDDFVDRLLLSSAGSAFTRLYDQFQYYSQGIL